MTPKKFENSKSPGHWVESPFLRERRTSSLTKLFLKGSGVQGRLRRALRYDAVLVSALSLCFLLACAAVPADGPTALTEPLPPDVIQARKVVERLQQETIAIARLGSKLSFEQRRKRLMELDEESFDFSRMARLSYGKGFEQLSPDQKRLWTQTFILLRCSGTAKVNSRDRGQKYRFVGYDQVSDNVVLVRSGVRYPKRAVEIFIDYRLRREQGRWFIVDRYSPPSVSEVVMRRAEYRPILQKEGFDGLILDMERRIRGYSSR